MSNPGNPISPEARESIDISSEHARSSRLLPEDPRQRGHPRSYSAVVADDELLLRKACAHNRDEQTGAIAELLERHPDWTHSYIGKITGELGLRQQMKRPKRSAPTPEDKQLLREASGKGPERRQQAHSAILDRHPDWTQRTVMNLARKLGTTRPCKKWTTKETRALYEMAGVCDAWVIAELMGRSSAAIEMKLKRLLGHCCARVVEGHSRRQVGRILHCNYKGVRLLLENESLKWIGPDILFSSRKQFVQKHAASLGITISPEMKRRLLRSRLPQTQQRLAAILDVTIQTVRRWINEGILRPKSARVSTESLEEYCREHYRELNQELMTAEEKDWLRNTVDGWRTSIPEIQAKLRACEETATFDTDHLEVLFQVDLSSAEDLLVRISKMAGSNSGGRNSRKIRSGKEPELLNKADILKFLENEAKKFSASAVTVPRRVVKAVKEYKHLAVIHHCSRCKRKIRGNAFFRHSKSCQGRLNATGMGNAVKRASSSVESEKGQRPVKESNWERHSVRAG